MLALLALQNHGVRPALMHPLPDRAPSAVQAKSTYPQRGPSWISLGHRLPLRPPWGTQRRLRNHGRQSEIPQMGRAPHGLHLSNTTQFRRHHQATRLAIGL